MRNSLVAVAALFFSWPVGAQLAPPNDSGLRFAHAHLYVADVDLTAALWLDLFGGELLEEAGYTALSIPGALIFFTEQAPTGGSSGTALDHVGLRVRNLDEVLGTWSASGYEVDSGPIGSEEGRRARITMPDGARVELTEDAALASPSAMHHVHFQVPRQGEAVEWYTDLLSVEIGTRGATESRAFVPGSTLSFTESHGEVTPTRGRAIDHVGFEVEDIGTFAELLASSGVEPESPPFYVESLDLWVVYFPDPHGARIEVTQGLDHFGR